MIIKLTNLFLLILFPIAWFAPLMRAGLLPFFKLTEISVITGIQSLWENDIFLALILIFFALIAPIIKIITTALIQFNFISSRFKPLMIILGKFAMLDIFLIALYIIIAKGISIGRIETAWGLYLFTACILTSYAISLLPSSSPSR